MEVSLFNFASYPYDKTRAPSRSLPRKSRGQNLPLPAVHDPIG